MAEFMKGAAVDGGGGKWKNIMLAKTGLSAA